MPAVPCGITARAYSRAVSIEDSIWICPSRNAGARYLPVASITVVPSPIEADTSPTAAIRPQETATSYPSNNSFVQTFTSFAPRMTRSAGFRPSATSASVRVHAVSGTRQNLFCILFPPYICFYICFSEFQTAFRNRPHRQSADGCDTKRESAARSAALQKSVRGMRRAQSGRADTQSGREVRSRCRARHIGKDSFI